jgi:uncharacterized RDD family membrane protein YckC
LAVMSKVSVGVGDAGRGSPNLPPPYILPFVMRLSYRGITNTFTFANYVGIFSFGVLHCPFVFYRITYLIKVKERIRYEKNQRRNKFAS